MIGIKFVHFTNVLSAPRQLIAAYSRRTVYHIPLIEMHLQWLLYLMVVSSIPLSDLDSCYPIY